MRNRRAGLSAVGKEVTPKDALQPVMSAFWGAGEYPSHCRRICGELSTLGLLLFLLSGRLFVPLFLFLKKHPTDHNAPSGAKRRKIW